jgi:hypothetical protein
MLLIWINSVVMIIGSNHPACPMRLRPTRDPPAGGEREYCPAFAIGMRDKLPAMARTKDLMGVFDGGLG